METQGEGARDIVWCERTQMPDQHNGRADNDHHRRYGGGGWRKEGESEREDDFWENRRAVRASIACPKGVWGRSPSPHSHSRRNEGGGKSPVNKVSSA